MLNLKKCNISVGEVRRDDVMTRGKGVKMGVRCVVVVDFFFFLGETNTHPKKRKNGFNIKIHHKSTQKPYLGML